MPEYTNPQLAFTGVDACSAPHLIEEGKCQSALNIDFDAEPGAAFVRRGSTLFGNIGTSTQITSIYRNYNLPDNISGTPYYFHAGTAIYRGVSGTYTAISSGQIQPNMNPTSYKGFAFLPNTVGVKDDGTTCTDWVKQSPSVAPAISVTTQTAFSPKGTATWTTVLGTAVSTESWNVDASSYKLEIHLVPVSTNLDLNGTHTIGDYGVDCLDISASSPEKITKISRDYSIGDTAFTNYWHTEFFPGDTAATAEPDVDVLIDSVLNTGSTTDGDFLGRSDLAASARIKNRPTLTKITDAVSVYGLWAVPRTKFDLISKSSVPSGWTSIQKVRVIIECSAANTIGINNWAILGSKDYPKNDPQVGYAYWQTWATVDSNGNIVGESAPSPATARLPVQNGQIQVIWSNTATSTPNAHGLTHSIIYANGGYMNDAYAVATISGLGGTYTDSMSDLDAMGINRVMQRNVYSKSEFEGALHKEYCSEPFYNRIFVSNYNKMHWSLPGKPDVFPRTSFAEVSHVGDKILGFVVWPPGLIIVNAHSVYELHGNIFEGSNSNANLARTGSLHGSKAPGTIIKTPYGIPLLDYDGLFMYIPGQGVSQPIQWVNEQIGDAFRLTGSGTPQVLKGNRVPQFSYGYCLAAQAAFADDKLYLALPTGTNSLADTVFVINFKSKQCQWYQYPWNVTAMFTDKEFQRVLVGLENGRIMQLEQTLNDVNSTGTAVSIPYSLKTRAWSVPTDNILENVALDVETPNGTVVLEASYDGGSLVALGTTTNQARDWQITPQGGTLSRDVVFNISGTHTGTAETVIHQMKWTAISQPERVRYIRTDYDQQDKNVEKWWDVLYSDIELVKTSTAAGTGTVTAVTFVDNTAVMTNTIVGPALIGSSDRKMYPFSFPAKTYGHICYTTYTMAGATNAVFKHYETSYASTPEPDRLNFVTSKEQTYPSDQYFKTWVTDINALTTVTGVAYVDGTAISTQTMTGSGRQTYNFGLDLTGSNTVRVGRKIEATYSAAAGSVFKHYTTNFETEPKPFGKKSWLVSYKKSGGATQLDMARFWSLDAESTSTSTITAFWDIDGTAFSTNTITCTGRAWADRIAFPPGGRGYLFQLRLTSSQNFEVYKSNLDIEMIGVKGLSRRTYVGTPSNG